MKDPLLLRRVRIGTPVCWLSGVLSFVPLLGLLFFPVAVVSGLTVLTARLPWRQAGWRVLLPLLPPVLTYSYFSWITRP